MNNIDSAFEPGFASTDRTGNCLGLGRYLFKVQVVHVFPVHLCQLERLLKTWLTRYRTIDTIMVIRAYGQL